MLTITVGGEDVFDEITQSFGKQGGFQLQLEHSLVALSKWESIHEKPFLDSTEKTPEEVLSYIECMVVSKIPPGNSLHELSKDDLERVSSYIESKRTATWFSDRRPQRPNREIITSELIYYWMTAFQIPFEAESWHLNRLLTLIRICNVKQEEQQQDKPQRMKADELAARRALNEQRKRELGTKG